MSGGKWQLVSLGAPREVWIILTFFWDKVFFSTLKAFSLVQSYLILYTISQSILLIL